MRRIEAEVSGLHFYPIKSCSGTELETVEVAERGFRYDRHWMVINTDGVFLTQREVAKMALIRPSLSDDRLIISACGEPSILELSFDNKGPRREVIIWGNKCEATDDGEIPAQWFSDFLDLDCKLVHMPSDFVREKRPGYGRLEFADSYPLLIVSEESLQNLNKRIQTNGGNSVPMNRFRPNIVVKGGDPYAEDSWKQVRINEVRFDTVKPCIRCPFPQIDQESAKKGKEPIKTLLGYRRVTPKEVVFAQKAVNLDIGFVEKGNQVEILERKDPPKFLE
mgnify:CR=1 FL=1